MSDQNYPSLPEQSANLVKSIGKVLKSILTTEEAIFASADSQKTRREICNGCDKNDREQNRCTECGCDLEMKIKFAAMTCPLQKWDLDEEVFEELIKKSL